MRRRDVLGVVSAGAAAASLPALANPAVVRGRPRLNWRLTSGFPRNLDMQVGACELMARMVSEMTDGQFSIEVFGAGQIAPQAEAPDRVASGAIEMCHVAAFWYIAKDPAWAVPCAIPFALNARLHNGWTYAGEGEKLIDEFFSGQGFKAIQLGNTGAQMGGWFSREVNAPEDFRGLRMRIGGMGGRVLQRLGLQPVNVPVPELAKALTEKRIDAAEWIGPYDDEKLGLNKAAPFYYYPSFWEGSNAFHLLINLAKWSELPASYQTALTAASAHAGAVMQARYDQENPAALRRIVEGGARLRPFSSEILQAARRAADETFAEIGKASPSFKKLHDSLMATREQGYLWFQFAEFNFDSFQVRARIGA